MSERDGQVTIKEKPYHPDNWMNLAKKEFQNLLAEQEMTLSPCSSKRNSKRIWLNEMCNIPLLERQCGFNNNYLNNEK
jgi:hypothetical protein